MTNYDFAPLLRTAVGFDRMARILESNQHSSANGGFPPHNIERTGENSYRISMAVAGFSPQNLQITAVDNLLAIKGTVARGDADNNVLHRGIAGRSFERKFVLADYVEVEDAQLEHGLLHVNLKRVVPESAKPRQIPISTVSAGPEKIREVEHAPAEVKTEGCGCASNHEEKAA